MKWACLAIFFLDLGLGDFALRDAWKLPPEGTGVGGFPAGQSSRRDQCTGTGPFKLGAYMRAYQQRHACYSTVRTTTTTFRLERRTRRTLKSEPPPPPPPPPLCPFTLAFADEEVAALVVDYSGMAGFAGDNAFCAAFPSVVVMPKMLGSMVGMTAGQLCGDIMPHSSPTAAVACFFLVLLVDAVRAVFPAFVGRLAARCVRQVCRPLHAAGSSSTVFMPWDTEPWLWSYRTRLSCVLQVPWSRQCFLSGQTMDIPQVQFWFVVTVECRHGPDSAENRGVLHAVPDQVVGLCATTVVVWSRR